ncbi:MAG: helix-turn-helix domain-containing protein [Pseudomonadota bacterium]
MFDFVAYAALVKQKRGVLKLSQENLAADALGDPARKSEISRIENGRTNPNESTIQKLNAALGITEVEMAPIRQSRLKAKDLDNLGALDRDDLELLATRFQILDAPDLKPKQLRDLLHEKAKDYRALRKEVDDLKNVAPRLANQHAAAMDALDNLRIEEAEEILANAREVVVEQLREPLEINAQLIETQAAAALTRGDVEAAYTLLASAADGFAAIDPAKQSQKKHDYMLRLHRQGERFGGLGFPKAIEMIKSALNDCTENSTMWAACKNALGMALQDQGRLSGGKDGSRLLAEAVTAYRDALTVTTRDEHPENWSMGLNNLATALADQGFRVPGEDGTRLLAEAVTACHDALTVRTRVDHPVEWAMTQNNLGTALANQGTRAVGEDGIRLLAEAVTAYSNALTVRTRDDHPMEWAMTLDNLGNALRNLSTRIRGNDGTRLVAEAVTAFQDALTVYTRDDHPMAWASTKNDLGLAFQKQGILTGGAEGTRLLAEAVNALREALTVTARDYNPMGWAGTQGNLALAKWAIALDDATTDPRPHLEAALAHVDGALTVYDPEHMSYNFENHTRLREAILQDLKNANS